MTGIKSKSISAICFTSRAIGAIEGTYLAGRALNEKSAKYYLEMSNQLDYEPDESIKDYIKQVYPHLIK